MQFGAGGWLVYLKGGSGPDLGLHPFAGQPNALVWTYGGTYVAWSQPFSHEVAEMLVDPTDADCYIWPNGPSAARNLRPGRELHVLDRRRLG